MVIFFAMEHVSPKVKPMSSLDDAKKKKPSSSSSPSSVRVQFESGQLISPKAIVQNSRGRMVAVGAFFQAALGSVAGNRRESDRV